MNPNEATEHPERRSHERRKSRVNKLVYASLEVDSVESKTFLYLVDISLGGLRANLDRALAKDSVVEFSLPLRPYLNEEVELQALCRVAWNRELLGGTFVHGFEFQQLQEEAASLVERLFHAFSPEGKRKRFRLPSLLNVAYHQDGAWKSWVARDISPQGLGLQMPEPLELEECLPFRIFLEDRGKYEPVEVVGRVSYLVEFDDDEFRLGVEFVEPTDEAARRIQDYIDRNSR
ncbi:MAG: PilZ domain-containing protein [Candidatus Eremiobacteraeota bacterium]|nr:PilZ domain-containing protein [Candidatus Eremiobacteraeota bacterium]